MARLARLYLEAERIQARVDELGRQIAAESPPDLLLVTMLKGGVPFLADLVRRLPPTVSVDFLALTPYGQAEHPPGVARLVKDLDQPLEGRHVLVVEDVVDTGLSLRFVLGILGERGPASLRVCTLLDREAKRLVDLPLAYRGFPLGDEYLVGYGLDFRGLYRNLPCLVAVEDLEALREEPLALAEQLRTWSVWPPRGVGSKEG